MVNARNTKIPREVVEDALESESWEYAYTRLLEAGMDEEEIYELLDIYFPDEEEEQ